MEHTATTTKAGEAGFDPADFTAAAGSYYADAATDFFNVQMNGSSKSINWFRCYNCLKCF